MIWFPDIASKHHHLHEAKTNLRGFTDHSGSDDTESLDNELILTMPGKR